VNASFPAADRSGKPTLREKTASHCCGSDYHATDQDDLNDAYVGERSSWRQVDRPPM
jgi:hypothetical protein